MFRRNVSSSLWVVLSIFLIALSLLARAKDAHPAQKTKTAPASIPTSNSTPSPSPSPTPSPKPFEEKSEIDQTSIFPKIQAYQSTEAIAESIAKKITILNPRGNIIVSDKGFSLSAIHQLVASYNDLITSLERMKEKYSKEKQVALLDISTIIDSITKISDLLKVTNETKLFDVKIDKSAFAARIIAHLRDKSGIAVYNDSFPPAIDKFYKLLKECVACKKTVELETESNSLQDIPAPFKKLSTYP